MRAFTPGLIAATLLLGSLAQGSGQTPVDFFKGRTIDLYIGYSVGGGYDIYARMIARHMGRHMPGNPTVIPKNMDGAGSIRLANWLYNRRAQGRHGIRHGFARRPVRPAARVSGHSVRRAGVQLDRQRQ